MTLPDCKPAFSESCHGRECCGNNDSRPVVKGSSPRAFFIGTKSLGKERIRPLLWRGHHSPRNIWAFRKNTFLPDQWDGKSLDCISSFFSIFCHIRPLVQQTHSTSPVLPRVMHTTPSILAVNVTIMTYRRRSCFIFKKIRRRVISATSCHDRRRSTCVLLTRRWKPRGYRAFKRLFFYLFRYPWSTQRRVRGVLVQLWSSARLGKSSTNPPQSAVPTPG